MAIATDNFNRGSIGSNWTNAFGTVVTDVSQGRLSFDVHLQRGRRDKEGSSGYSC